MLVLTSNIYNEINRMRDEINRLFRTNSFNTYTEETAYPLTNIYSTDDQIRVAMLVPGIDAEKVDINFYKGVLTVSGEKKIEIDEKRNYLRREIGSGSFSKSLRLGEDVNPDSINAKYTNGVLEITLDKKEEVKPKKISIN